MLDWLVFPANVSPDGCGAGYLFVIAFAGSRSLSLTPSLSLHMAGAFPGCDGLPLEARGACS
jgi:hypothetical protein